MSDALWSLAVVVLLLALVTSPFWTILLAYVVQLGQRREP